MRLTSKGRYAVTAMLDVALNSEAARYRWLIFPNVREFPFLIWNNCFPVCVKWSGFQRTWTSGGYLLGKDASSIAVGEVISAVDESVDATRCQGKGGCQGGDKCLTHALWRDLSDRLTGFSITLLLGELVNNCEVLDVSGRQHTTTRHAPAHKTQSTLSYAHKDKKYSESGRAYRARKHGRTSSR